MSLLRVIQTSWNLPGLRIFIYAKIFSFVPNVTLYYRLAQEYLGRGESGAKGNVKNKVFEKRDDLGW